MKGITGFIIVVVLCALMCIDEIKNLPAIVLPEFMQHNTIGELPFVEVMDDGDFYEVDGEEGKHKSFWCDEVGFTCNLKFGQSYGVARRIFNKKVLKTCKEARKQSQDELAFCIEQAEDYRAKPESVSFYTDWYQDSIARCIAGHLYIPECDGDYLKWLFSPMSEHNKLSIPYDQVREYLE